MQKYKQIIRFVIVGVCSTLVNFFVYLILYKITAKISLSVYVGYCTGLLISYAFGKKWVFRLSGNLKLLNKILFFLTYITGGIIMTLLTTFLENIGLNHKFAWLIGISYAVINNFLGSKFLVFKKVKN